MNLATLTKGHEELYPTPNTYKTNHLMKNHPHNVTHFYTTAITTFCHYNIKIMPPCHQIYLKNVSFPLMQPDEGRTSPKTEAH